MPDPALYLSIAFCSRALLCQTHPCSMAFEIHYRGLPSLTGLFGADRELYWLQEDVELLFQKSLPTTSSLCAHHVMPDYPVTAAFFRPVFLKAPLLTHDQLCQVFREEAATQEVHDFGAALHDQTLAMNVFKAHLTYRSYARYLPVLLMAERVQVVPPPPRVLDDRVRARILDAGDETPVPWFLWLCCFDAWAQEHIYAVKDSG